MTTRERIERDGLLAFVQWMMFDFAEAGMDGQIAAPLCWRTSG